MLRAVRFLPLVLIVSIGNAVVALLYAWLGAVSASQSSFLIASAASVVVPVLIVLAVRRSVLAHPV